VVVTPVRVCPFEVVAERLGADGTSPELLTGVVTEALESTGEDELAASPRDWVSSVPVSSGRSPTTRSGV